MSRALVIIESPYAGNVEVNVAYARACVLDSLKRGESPVAFHLLHTQPGILQDQTPQERELGISAGLEWYRVATLCAVYTDLGYSNGMWQGITKAKMEGVPIQYRTVPAWAVIGSRKGP